MSYFGTDGIRGQFGISPITPEFALRLGFATGAVLKRAFPKKKPIVVMGKDTRLSGYILESALQAGLNSAGVYVHLLGPLPTPAIAHLTRALHANAGIVISASHNPYFDNGIKFFSSDGKKLADDLQEQINQELEKDIIIQELNQLGKSFRVDDAQGRYIEFCKSTFPYHLNLQDFTIVMDCANGAAYSVGPAVFRELGAKVISIFDQPNGTNINEQCGSTHPDNLQQAVIKHRADLGIAFDGDADRVMLVDRNGQLIDGDHILYILATKGKSVLVEQETSLDELVKDFKLFPQVLENVRLAQMIDLFADPVLEAEFEKAEQQLKGRGRLLIRKSGTEPVIRVMVEGDNLDEVSQLAKHLADQIRKQANIHEE